MVSSIRQVESKEISSILLEANFRSCQFEFLSLLLGLGSAAVSSEWLGCWQSHFTLAAPELYPLSPWHYAVAEIFVHIFSLLPSPRFLKSLILCMCRLRFDKCLKGRMSPVFELLFLLFPPTLDLAPQVLGSREIVNPISGSSAQQHHCLLLGLYFLYSELANAFQRKPE